MKDLLIECCTQFVGSWLENHKDMKGHIVGKVKATEMLKFCNDYGVYATWTFDKDVPHVVITFYDADTESELIQDMLPIDDHPWVPFALVMMDRVSGRDL